MNVERIRELCKEHGTNLMRLEQAVGFPNGTIRRWGENVPAVTKVKTVADYFGVTVDELLTEGGPEEVKTNENM